MIYNHYCTISLNREQLTRLLELIPITEDDCSLRRYLQQAGHNMFGWDKP